MIDWLIVHNQSVNVSLSLIGLWDIQGLFIGQTKGHLALLFITHLWVCSPAGTPVYQSPKDSLSSDLSVCYPSKIAPVLFFALLFIKKYSPVLMWIMHLKHLITLLSQLNHGQSCQLLWLVQMQIQSLTPDRLLFNIHYYVVVL